MSDLISLLITFALLLIASITGSIAEKRHYKSIKEILKLNILQKTVKIDRR